MNKILPIIGVIILLVALPLAVFLIKQRQEWQMKAAPATVLSLDPAVLSKDIGESFQVNVKINTNENKVVGADIKLVYDPSILEATSITASSFLDSPQILKNTIDSSTGLISFSIASFTEKQGTGILAVVNFKGLAAGTSTVTFGAGNSVAGIGETEALSNTSSGTYTIGAAAPASPSPSPVVSPSPSPSVAPGASPSPAVSPSPKIGCNITCETDADCEGDFICYDTGSVSKCLDPSCTEETDCTCNNSCWEVCTNDTECPEDLSCRQIDATKRCVNTSCQRENDCDCTQEEGLGGGATVASPSPSPRASNLPQSLPETGITTPTTLILGLGGAFLLIGLLTFFL